MLCGKGGASMSVTTSPTVETIEITNQTTTGIQLAHDEILKKAGTDSQKSVLTRINEKIEFLTMGMKEDRDAFLIVKASDGVNVKAVGMISISRQSNGNWYINDLVSVQPGTGTTLVNAGLEYIKKQSAKPDEVVHLLSLDDDSTEFWKKKGFELENANSTMTTNRPMKKKLV
jgi:hypothetical protein